MSTATIDKWTREDCSEILRIWNLVQPGRDYDPLDEVGLVRRIAGGDSSSAEGAFVARVDDDVAGFALAKSSIDRDQGFLCALMVDPERQRHGIGRQLLLAAEELLITGGVQRANVAPEDCPAVFTIGVNMATPAYRFLLNHGYRSMDDPQIWFDLDLAGFSPRPEIDEYSRANSVDGIDFGLCDARHRESLCELANQNPGITESLSGEGPYPVMIAYQNDRVVGFSGPFGVASSGRGGFMGVVTDPDFRRRGIGSVLFEMMCLELRNRGATYTNLYTGLRYGAQEIYFAAGCKATHVTDASLCKNLT